MKAVLGLTQDWTTTVVSAMVNIQLPRPCVRSAAGHHIGQALVDDPGHFLSCAPATVRRSGQRSDRAHHRPDRPFLAQDREGPFRSAFGHVVVLGDGDCRRGAAGPVRSEQRGLGEQPFAVVVHRLGRTVLPDGERVGERACGKTGRGAADVNGAVRHPAVEQVALDFYAARVVVLVIGHDLPPLPNVGPIALIRITLTQVKGIKSIHCPLRA